MNYLFWALVHCIGVLGFQYTDSEWFLVVSVAHVSLSMLIFTIGAAAALNPNYDYNDDEDEEEIVNSEYGFRFLLQISFLVTATAIYNLGYAFFAGMIVLKAIILALTITLQKIDSIKE